MANPWLAIDSATPPGLRAREVRRAWECFVATGSPDTAGHESSGIRGPIAASWRRSAAAGVDPRGYSKAPVVADVDETSARWEIHPLAEMAPLIQACLASTADESQHLIVVSDASGMLLWIEGAARVRLRAADSMNFSEGALWSEGGAGTNAIGTALAAEHAVQVFASEHFNEVVQEWTCAAAPVHDPDTGRVIGVIDLTGAKRTVHPHSMAVAVATSQALEAQLRCEMLNRDARLLSRHGDLLRRGERRALLAASGRVVAVRPLGWLPAARLTVPNEGGVVMIGSQFSAMVEPLAGGAFLVSAIVTPPGREAARSRLTLKLLGGDRGEAMAGTDLDGAPGVPLRPAPRRDPHAAVRQPRWSVERGPQ
jgi:transcriptional regulator of acetoin/glycerol metabolism